MAWQDISLPTNRGRPHGLSRHSAHIYPPSPHCGNLTSRASPQESAAVGLLRAARGWCWHRQAPAAAASLPAARRRHRLFPTPPSVAALLPVAQGQRRCWQARPGRRWHAARIHGGRRTGGSTSPGVVARPPSGDGCLPWIWYARNEAHKTRQVAPRWSLCNIWLACISVMLLE